MGFWIIDCAEPRRGARLDEEGAPPGRRDRSSAAGRGRAARRTSPARSCSRRVQDKNVAEVTARPRPDPCQRRRPHVPAGVGTGGRVADPGPRRLRPRRRGRPGGIRRRARALAARRHPRQPRGLDHPGRPQPCDRPAPPRPQPAREDRDPRGTGGAAAAGAHPRGAGGAATEIEDDRLRLIFTCCHPALAQEARVALTLRTPRRPQHAGDRPRLPGRGEHDGAAPGPGRNARSRRPGSPTRSRTRSRCPSGSPECWRRSTWSSTRATSARASADLVRVELSTEAIRLCRLLVDLLPSEPEAKGLLALMLLTDSRRLARVDAGGGAVPLEEQDRGLWDQRADRRGPGALGAGRGRRAGRPLHRAGADRRRPRPRRAARADRLGADRPPLRMAGTGRPESGGGAQPGRGGGDERGSGAGLALIEAIEGLDDYRPLHSARADLLRRLGRDEEAADAYARALEIPATRSRPPTSSGGSPRSDRGSRRAADGYPGSATGTSIGRSSPSGMTRIAPSPVA